MPPPNFLPSFVFVVVVVVVRFLHQRALPLQKQQPQQQPQHEEGTKHTHETGREPKTRQGERGECLHP